MKIGSDRHIQTSSYTIITIFVLLFVIGIAFAFVIPVSLNPGTALPSLNISFSYPRASSMAVEQEVTSVIEGAMNTLGDVKSIRSQSQREAGLITIAFDKGVDMQLKRQEVSSILRYTYSKLPDEVPFPDIFRGEENNNEENIPILNYAIISALPEVAVSQIVQGTLIDVLSIMKGVHEVRLEGIQPKVIEIQFQFDKMKHLGLSSSDISDALRRSQTRLFLGNDKELKRTGTHSMPVVLEHRLNSIDEIGNIPIARVGTRLIRLSEIAELIQKENRSTSAYRVNGKQQITLRIFAEKGSNEIKVAKEVKAKIEDIKKSLNKEVSLILKRDSTRFLAQEIEKIVFRSTLTLLILLAFVFLIYHNWRYVSIILPCLIANVGIAFLLYYIFNVELHLFSFAGITVTFGMMIDNIIIMIDHINSKNNLKVFMAILSATLTTISALGIIFFLNDRSEVNLVDFAIVVIINLSTSLLIALFLVPALAEKLLVNRKHSRKLNSLKKIIWWSKINSTVFNWSHRYRMALFTSLIFAFGLPVFLLPSHIESNSGLAQVYNNTIGSKFYQGKIKEIVNNIFGGTLKVFVDHVIHFSFEREREETNIRVKAQMPKGSTFEQIDEVMQQMERFLLQFQQIDYFETMVQNPEYATMNVYFKSEWQTNGFPLQLLNYLRMATNQLGSAEWHVTGAGDGFNNSTMEQNGQYCMYLYGYSYETLQSFAHELEDSLSRHPRVDNINVSGQASTFKNQSLSYIMKFDHEKLARGGLNVNAALSDFSQQSMVDMRQGDYIVDEKSYQLVLTAQRESNFDLWHMNNEPVSANGTIHRVSNFGSIYKEVDEEGIFKMNQLYQLTINFDFIGTVNEGYDFLENQVKIYREGLPIGFDINTLPERYVNKNVQAQRNFYILTIVILIYIICAILLESLWQPLAVIIMIPVSFVGVFISFAFFDIEFNLGGYSGILLLSGITVNSALYLINDLNRIRKGNNDKRIRNYHLKTYLKAFNQKIVPILLTLISTILGMVPFLMAGKKETFWFSLAVSTVGGLIFSLVALYFYLPIFFIKGKDEKKKEQEVDKIVNLVPTH